MANQSVDLLNSCQKLRERMVKGNHAEVTQHINTLEEKLNANEDLSTEATFFTLSTLAKYYRKVNNYAKAGQYSRQALRLSKNIDANHMDIIIDTHFDYALLERKYGQHANARIELAKLLSFLESNQYQKPYAYGAIYHILGKISLDEKNMINGISQLEQSLAHFRKAVPQTHPVILETANTLSEAYIQTEDYHKAIELYRQLMAAYQQAGDQVSEARTLLKIGEIYFYIDLKEARRTITKAVQRLTEIYEDDHLDIAKAILMLAEIDATLAHFPRAIKYYNPSLRHLTTFYPKDHFMIVYVYSKIGTISMKTFQLKQAKEYLEQGLELAEKFPKIRQQFLYALGKMYSDEGAYDKAYTVFLEFMQRLDQEGRRKSLAYGNTLQAIAFNELKQEKLESALHYYQEALDIYKTLPHCKAEEGLTYIRLAYCYEHIQAKDVKKAEALYEEGFRIIEKTRHPDLLEEALAELIEFFQRINKPQKRKIYEDKWVKRQTSKDKS